MGTRGGSGVDFRKLNPGCATHSGLLTGWVAIAAAMIVVAPAAAGAAMHASIVVDARTGRVLEAHNADKPCYPASLAKLMTLYVTFQRLSSGRMSLRQRLRVSSHAAAQPPMKLWLHRGQRISVRSAILAITTRSANDAAVVLADAVAGSEKRFAHLMNRTAARLGLRHTTFYNASGLPNRRQRTTARDMAKLALAIMYHFPQYYHFFKVRSFVFRGKRIDGHDHLLDLYRGTDGLKTGYIRASGYNIVTSAVRHGRRLVGVVMGGSSIASRDRLMMALLDRGFAHPSSGTMLAETAPPSHASHASTAFVKVSDREGEARQTSSHHEQWLVQIGTYFHSPRHVRHALRSAGRSASASLNGARAIIVKLRHHRYYARFSNVSEPKARQACRILRKKNFTCKVLHLRQSTIAVASAGR